ncbi:MAG: alpha/beta hydrolase [Bacteroidota bacterium]|nr:alpha/beta hydrolase [Bacteroidota bacterium]
MRHVKFMLLLLSGILLVNVTGLAQQPASLINVPYKVIQHDTLRLDIYPPTVRKSPNVPVVVYIHGGSWISGDKTAVKDGYRQNILTSLTNRGYAVVSIDYRLVSPKTHFPSPVVDCKDAIRWIRKQAGTYLFDSKNIGVWGSSAGGHLAMLLAYSNDNDFAGAPELRTYSSKVSYIVDNFGPVNVNKLFKPGLCHPALWVLKLYSKALYDKRQFILSSFTGTDIDHDKRQTGKLCTLYSPINYVSGKSVPILIFHGDKDEIVPLGQSKELVKALKKEGIEHDLIVYKGGKHGLMEMDQANNNDIIDRSVEFIEQHTKK